MVAWCDRGLSLWTFWLFLSAAQATLLQVRVVQNCFHIGSENITLPDSLM